MKRSNEAWGSMKKIMIAIFVCHLMETCAVGGAPVWTTVYTKEISAQDTRVYRQKDVMMFARSSVLPFTQLIFSWNAVRPKKGYFSFLVTARDARTKKWSEWYTMMDWGAGIQRSYDSESAGQATEYHHVRLEIPSGKKADAFQIKIVPHEGASLAGMRAVFVNAIDHHQFVSEIDDPAIARLPSVRIANIPRYSQMKIDHEDASRMCSPTSSSMLVSMLCGISMDPLLFARDAYDDGLKTYGNWQFNTAHAFEVCRGLFTFHVERLASFATVHEFLKSGTPVVVSVRGSLPGAPKVYESGHLLIVVGYDRAHEKVLCHDPAFVKTTDVAVAYKLADFLRAWERSRRLAYIARPREQW